ncbi:MAG: hypothetical protein ACFCA4_07675 [Cyanophyceae cyanobacterium]
MEGKVNATYRFLHDRVQQAAYSLISSDQKAETHWRIGCRLWQSGAENQNDKLFDLVNQLNLGQAVIPDLKQIYALAQLNLRAARQAQQSAAYGAATLYCKTGLLLLPSQAWETQYDLIYGLALPRCRRGIPEW